ncbi:HutD family protein [Providencia hangzhouensis]|uniref:HutD/Ves family protein n=2 Tax=Providencia TaxID=586 RepID=UPI001D0D5741|nr:MULTISPECIES: HutD family protein [Providencia]MCF8961680.1 Protein Ves [Providencia rettgeri]UDQ65739.1 HutD family protein [Providencia rettgeri]WOB98083.1 HutD family protein [Providencia sp. PROV046]CAB5549755.1 Various environmental stresses-induced protein [Providencia rettgeri]CAC9142262.1 Various environmental stresses-induced protein [Providencia rettgeri]
MKIKCFDIMELPILDWNDGAGASQEVFCWPVASDYSLRASIATINQDSYLKRYAEGERLVVLLNDQPLLLSDTKAFEHRLERAGDHAQFSAQQFCAVKVSEPSVKLMNFIFRDDRWVAINYFITEDCRLPANQAGLVYVLNGEWEISGANCHHMAQGQGAWWLPDIGEGEIKPLSTDSKLIWIELLPR